MTPLADPRIAPRFTVQKSGATSLQATGGSGSFAWSVTAGALPAGLTLSSGGILSGGATAVRTASLTAQAVSGPVNASNTARSAVHSPGSPPKGQAHDRQRKRSQA